LTFFIASADGVVVADDQCVPPEGRVDLLTIHGRPLEETVSRRAILARYSHVMGLHAATHVDVQDIADRARVGEIVARQVLEEAMVALGETLVPWLECFGARVVVVGGSMAGSWDVLARPLRTGMNQAAGVEVVCAAMPNDAALVGAAWHAAEQSVRS
jgi:glucokinase